MNHFLRSKGTRAMIWTLLLLLVISPAVGANGGPASETPPASDVVPSQANVPITNGDKQLQTGELYQFFEQAAKEFDVPMDILLAIGYAESRWNQHEGASQLNGYGLMHLADNPHNQSLVLAADLLKQSEDVIKSNRKHNIRGAAAVLQHFAQELNEATPTTLADWYTTVAEYSGLESELARKIYADDVYQFINDGVYAVVDDKDIYLEATSVEPHRGHYAELDDMSAMSSAEYPGARWVAAHSSNYTSANRESDGNTIDYVIVHTTQGSYAGAISWFQNSSSNVSAHYVLRSSDGEVTQMVHHKDIGWHAGNWEYNKHSIGLEHEGYVDDPSWYTDVMYRSSADLTRWICERHNIPKTRSRIIGHNEVPGATHTDPGPHWDWNYYMSLVTGSTGGGGSDMIVDNSTSGRFLASSNWDGSSWSSQKYGDNYRFTTPLETSDAAWYKFDVPSRGNYAVYAWWPANSGYNNNTPYVISTASGNQVVHVDQRYNGGKWNYLGTFDINGGDDWVVGVSRWTNGSGYIIADAVRLVEQ
ncbi:N-acetylmuramoyl-L-alanine amidase [Caldalkalibacillus salinus]|uniref:golvesin C-terminal-like domain-containing protein n=1 Tax=Caldalkalibacillus salinus TaxID=2803787 RepID=UPI00192236C0|nr:N-acetylmuramoyl-L-alanine amidase [Caldalkalibacillus salinus]